MSGAFMPLSGQQAGQQEGFTMIRKVICGAGALGASLMGATAAFAQEAAASVAAAAPTPEATEAAAAATSRSSAISSWGTTNTPDSRPTLSTAKASANKTKFAAGPAADISAARRGWRSSQPGS